MKKHVLRRAGALVLALAMALSLAVTPAWAEGTDSNTTPSLKISEDELSLEPGETSRELKATLTNGPGNGVTYTYEWSCSPDNQITFSAPSTDTTTVTAGQQAEVGQYTITVTATWTVTADDGSDETKTLSATCPLTVAKANDSDDNTGDGEDDNTPPGGGEDDNTPGDSTPVAVTGVTLNKNTLSLTIGGSETLTATVEPANAANKNVTWSTSDSKVATVSSGKVTAVSKGTATITAKTADGGFTATCEVTVSIPSATGLTFDSDRTIVRGVGSNYPNPWDLTVALTPAGAELGDGKIEWSVQNKDASASKAGNPTWPAGSDGLTIRVTDGAPGEYTFKAEYNGYEATRDVTISGIALSASETTMLVGGNKVLSVDKMFGYAASGSPTDVVWTSSDPSVVTVINGELLAWKLGGVVITATKGEYSAECKVTVVEDESVIAGPYSATTGDPLILSTAYADLNTISLEKTKTETVDANGTPATSSSPLDYITNLMVPTDQGTLYYNYNSEANTGEGIGVTDCFAYQGYGTIRSLSMLYFVPRQGFTGMAEITFNGRAQDGTVFSGVIKVDVTGADSISYRTNAGVPAYFLSSDFNSFCRSRMGRDLNYVTFNLPQSSQGTLYFNYSGSGQNADRVSTSTQYSRSGRYTIDDVCFVPNDAFVGTATITYRGVDTAGQAFTGEITVIVSAAGAEGETANVYISAQRGQPVVLQANLFNDACQATIRDTLSYVTFKLPDFDEGTLYYNYRGAGDYDSRVSTTTRYFYSGVPGISGVTFVPASNSTGRVAIPYTGYGAGNTTFTGTLYISIGDTERATVRYFVPKNGTVNFDPNDFNNAGLLQIGSSVDYVVFQLPDEISLGALYYDYLGNRYYNNGVYSDFEYYRNPEESYQGQLGLISFHAGAAAGSVTIPYTAYTAASSTTGARESFQGAVVIWIGSPTPADASFASSTSGQVWLSAHTLSSMCSPVMSKNLSYIEITSVPPAAEGRVYSNYLGFKTGTEVKQGDRFYCIGAPSIDQLSFIPHGGFTGKAEITYIGFSSDGQEQVSGRIVVTVTSSTASQYFNDMANHVWAADAVDFLYRNNTVQGVGGGRFDPTGYISKGDFALMLVRAFGFTANGTVSYQDVPADSYYAQAISIASQLGIASGSNGYFYPDEALSRQDAMVMIYNALAADGWKLTNGLAADLSGYYDQMQIASDAREAVGSLVQMGIVQGDGNGYLRPQGLLNRAETAVLLHSIMTL